MLSQLTVGQRIRRLREERGRREGKNLTQQWLADQLKVSKSAVTKWEGDIQQPGAGAALSLANLFGVPLDTFVVQDAQSGDAQSPEFRAKLQADLAPYQELEVVDVSWLPRLIELVLTTTTDPRARMVLVESINAAGRTQAAIREAVAAERRGEAMKLEGTASDSRAVTARLSEENAQRYHEQVFSSDPEADDPIAEIGEGAVLDSPRNKERPRRAPQKQRQPRTTRRNDL
jgi:transcriptional regulator with XRE-family HTH domain